MSSLSFVSEKYLLIGFQSGRVCVRLLDSGRLVHWLQQSEDTSNTDDNTSNYTNNTGNTNSNTGNTVHSIAVSGNGKVVTSHDNG